MSAISELDKLFNQLEANLDKFDIPPEKKAVFEWFIHHSFNSYLPALASIRSFLEGKSANLTLLEALYESFNARPETVIA